MKLRGMGVQSVEDDPNYVPGIGLRAEPGKEVMVTVFDVIPEGLQVGFEKAIIAVGLFLLAFIVVDGFAIAYEAYGIATKNPIPPEQDKFIVETLQPAFTPAMLSLLGCSSVLGIFKMGQMQRAGVQYKED